MKILFLSDANSIHTKKWVIALAQNGVKVYLFSLEKNVQSEYSFFKNIEILESNYGSRIIRKRKNTILSVFWSLPRLNRAINKIKPEIIHAHYATSYGLLGVMTGLKPLIISVWGSDIYSFPKKSFAHKYLIKCNLHKANLVLSTSNAMMNEAKKYTKKNILVTPFGIDLSVFKKIPNIKNANEIVIGTVKKLSSKYGIEYLIQAFKIVKENNSEIPLKLLIVGDGEDKSKLKKLAFELKISDDIEFHPAVDNNSVPLFLNKMDVFAALSLSESFGVAIIEASACEVPVVVSNVGGLPEVVENNKTGLVVEARNPENAAVAIEKLIHNVELRVKMGKAGRERVKNYYDWEVNVNQMLDIYKNILSA